jgi:hypothetical protein
MSDALDLRTAILPLPFNVRFWGECVAKLFPALRSRNNRILLDSAANQHCVFSSDVESIISPTRPQSASSIERDFRTHNTRNVCSLGALLLRSRGAPTPSLGLGTGGDLFRFKLSVRCPLLAQSGHSEASHQCPLTKAKRTSTRHAAMSANNPKRTSLEAITHLLAPPIAQALPASAPTSSPTPSRSASTAHKPDNQQ